MSIHLNPSEPFTPRVFRSRWSLAPFGIGTCLLSLSFLLSLPVRAQLQKQAPATALGQPEAPKDSLGRSTPKGAVLRFLSAARNGEDELAAQYLNTRLRGKAAAVLAHQLFVVLDR